ncbi:MAG TPA: SMC-Scp complex subunit ScpB [Gemmataceae bacterium]|jgi:segregation and condensation protein B|nr:SMC-Scp complex subunit ScpB [Gemmataceae bacterium]
MSDRGTTDEVGEIDGCSQPVDSDAPPPPLRIIEAMLFVGGAPVTMQRTIRLLRGLPAEQFTAAIDELNREYRRQNRPYAIVPQGTGYVLTLRPKFLPLAERLRGAVRETRLSTAAVDVLALVAYRQPVAKAEVDGLRGAESGAVLRQLVRRGLIQVAATAGPEASSVAEPPAALYVTSPRFLEMFGLSSLDDLPKTKELGTIV